MADKTDRERELEGRVLELEQQLVALDRILSGRQVAASSIGAEASLMLAPYLHVGALLDDGPEANGFRGPVELSHELRWIIRDRDGRHESWVQFARRGQLLRGLNDAAPRVILALVGRQR